MMLIPATVQKCPFFGARRHLLTTSADPGVAVLAPVAIPGTILGKALDALDSGSGTIRIVVALR